MTLVRPLHFYVFPTLRLQSCDRLIIRWHQPTATLRLDASTIFQPPKYTRRLRSLAGHGLLDRRRSSPSRSTHFTRMQLWDHQRRVHGLLVALGYQPRTKPSLSLPSGLTEFTARCMACEAMLRSPEDFLMKVSVTPFRERLPFMTSASLFVDQTNLTSVAP